MKTIPGDETASLDAEFAKDVYPAEIAALRKRASARTRSKERPSSLPDFDTHLRFGANTGRSAFLARTLALLTDPDQERRWQEWAGEKPEQRHGGLTGLALSGGGIRSSTINLGIVQVLHRVGLFKCLDYLSTVSGGGYVGSSLSACYSPPLPPGPASPRAMPLTDETPDEVDAKFPYQHTPGSPEPPAFVQLRDFSNFLVPRGFIDYLRFPVLLIRGVLINFLVMLPWIIGAALLSAWFMSGDPAAPAGSPELGWRWTAAFRDALPAQLSSLGRYPFTLVCTTIFVALAVLFPIARRFERPSEGHDMLRRFRNYYERLMVVVLSACALAFVIDVQPYAIRTFVRLGDGGAQPGLVGALASASALLASFGKVFMQDAARLLSRVALYLIALLGLAAFWAIYLALCANLLPAPVAAPAGTLLPDVWVWSMSLLGVLIFYTLFVDANGLSLHNFYRDRIAKAFLFRVDDAKNDVQPLLDLPLTQLSPTLGPLHVVNATLNTREFPEQFRKGRHAEPFFLSPLFTGSRLTGYCQTSELEKRQGDVTLSTAVTTSGAAFSPNMGQQTSLPLRFIAAVLNLRLGYWLLNPRNAKPSATLRQRLSSQFRVGVIRYLQELFGWLSYRSDFVYLSDGGHIDNLGLYELVRRQCRFIVAGDGEADPHYTFHALTEAMRLIRVDFGVQIEMDGLDEIRSGEQQFARGTIHYPGGRRGYFIYLKSSLLGDDMIEATVSPGGYISSPLRRDVRHFDELGFIAQYKSRHPMFPHESTADQFFDEKQFESYRSLGYLIANRALTVGI